MGVERGDSMADEVRVSPTPIQRNVNDVALELTKMYYETYNVGSIEEIQETYARFYAIAARMDSGIRTYDKLITEKILNNL